MVVCENVLLGGLYKFGDIISFMVKKIIEVLNMDVEGRFILVDVIYYIINNEKVIKVVDVVILIGVVLILLGNVVIFIVINNDDFYCELEKVVILLGERVWKMLIYDEFKDMIKGEEVDFKNIGGKNVGCIIVGVFIGEFVGNIFWIYMDIVGISILLKLIGYKVKGVIGEFVRILYYLVEI